MITATTPKSASTGARLEGLGTSATGVLTSVQAPSKRWQLAARPPIVGGEPMIGVQKAG
jgi:hypothetical protein